LITIKAANPTRGLKNKDSINAGVNPRLERSARIPTKAAKNTHKVRMVSIMIGFSLRSGSGYYLVRFFRRKYLRLGIANVKLSEKVQNNKIFLLVFLAID
jgi:hypothetical protein